MNKVPLCPFPELSLLRCNTEAPQLCQLTEYFSPPLITTGKAFKTCHYQMEVRYCSLVPIQARLSSYIKRSPLRNNEGETGRAMLFSQQGQGQSDLGNSCAACKISNAHWFLSLTTDTARTMASKSRVSGSPHHAAHCPAGT